MSDLVQKNINYIQILARQEIEKLIVDRGYVLTKDEHYKEGIETRIFVWTNTSKNHRLRLIWDGREHWLDLSESQSKNDTNHSDWKDIVIVPLNVVNVFFCSYYAKKKVNQIRTSLAIKLN